MTNPAHLSGLRHLDSFIVTPNYRPFIGTLQKRMPTLTQTATQLNRRAVNNNTAQYRHIRLPALQVILFIVTRQFLAVYQLFTATLNWYSSSFVLGDISCDLDNFLRQPHNLANARIKNWLPATFTY
jgi:hypothetical protein